MAKLTSTKDNLTKIKGIGPKIQSLLNAKGIKTFKDLATAKKTTLDAILTEAGPRFKMHDSSTWMKQAKEFAKSSSTPKTVKPKAKPKAIAKPKAKPKTSSKPKTKPKTNAKPKATAKPKAKPKTSPKPKAKPKATTKPKAKPKTSAKPKAAPKTSLKPKAKSKVKPSTSGTKSKNTTTKVESIRFRKVMKELRGNVEGLTRMTVRGYRKQAKRDAQKILRDMKKDLRRWTRMLESGELTTQDFEFLCQSNIASAKMSALEQSGLAQIRVQAFRSAMFTMVIDTILGLVFRGVI